ncbi:MAG TPA: PPA1309 family protein [Frankiaceae bacterium]|nr:PPA1309 family protein [Frankiaceae bacterium]
MPYDLPATVAEIERQLADGGWDQPQRLYALVHTGRLRETEPGLADLLADSDADSLTPVEQDAIDGDVAEFLSGIEWPAAVDGCALVNEVVLLPDGAAQERPDGVDESEWAEAHPDARDVRLVVGVLRGGERASVLRIRGVDGGADDVLAAPDLVPNLALALLATLGELPDDLADDPADDPADEPD